MSCCIYDWERSVYIDISKKLTDNETIDFDIKENGYLLKNGCKALGMPPMSLVVLKWILNGYSYTRLKINLELRPELNKMLVLYNEYDVCYSTPKEDGKLTIISREEFDDMINGNPKTKISEEKIIDAIITSIEEDSSVYEQSVSPQEMLDWLKEQNEKLKRNLTNKKQ